MPFLFLLLFALVSLQGKWPQNPGWLAPLGSLLLVWSIPLLSWLLASLLARFYAWEVIQNPGSRHTLNRQFLRWKRWHFFGMLGCYLGALYGLGWAHLLKLLWAEHLGPVPGQEIVLLLPFLLAVLLSWERFHLMEQTLYQVSNYPDLFVGKREYLLLQVRHNLLIVMPPMFLLVLQQSFFALFPGLHGHQHLLPVIGFGMIAVALVSIPFLLRFFLGLQSMPAGPLRERLESTARRLKFGYRDIMVWNTRMTVANAMVSGFLPWSRYIVLTDRLIDELAPDEIEAVFGHEVGHVKHHHMFAYMLFFFTSLIVLGAIWQAGQAWLETTDLNAWATDLVPEWRSWADQFDGVATLVAILLAAAYVFLVFGWLSRRCERQADLFGARAVSSEAFVSALVKVAQMNGIPYDRPSHWLLAWQHPTIAQRVDFVRKMSREPNLEPRFQFSVGAVKWGMVLALGAVVVCLGPVGVWNLLKWL